MKPSNEQFVINANSNPKSDKEIRAHNKETLKKEQVLSRKARRCLDDIRLAKELDVDISEFNPSHEEDKKMVLDQTKFTNEHKTNVITLLAASRSALLPGQIRQKITIEKAQLSTLLKHLRALKLVHFLSNGVYTLSKTGVEYAKSTLNVDVCGNVITRSLEHANDSAVPKPKVRAATKAKAVAKTRPAPATKPVEPTQNTPSMSFDDLFKTNRDIDDKGVVLLKRLFDSLNSEHLTNAGFSPADIYDFGDVYLYVKNRCEAAEVA